MPLMTGVALVVIQRELGVPSMRQIWQEHLYELQSSLRNSIYASASSCPSVCEDRPHFGLGTTRLVGLEVLDIGRPC